MSCRSRIASSTMSTSVVLPKTSSLIGNSSGQSRSTQALMQNKDKQDQESAHPTCSVCGGKLTEIRAKLQCS